MAEESNSVVANDFGRIGDWTIARLQLTDIKNARLEVRFVAAKVRIDGTLASGGRRSEISVSCEDDDICAYAYPCDPVSGERRDAQRNRDRKLAPDPIPIAILGTIFGMREDALKRAAMKVEAADAP
jgi:hypothetical protein